MTVIAFDGRRIAVDSRITRAGRIECGRKWKRLADGTLVLWEGDVFHALELLRWYEDGADPAQWPERDSPDARLIVVRDGQIHEYAGPHPIEHAMQVLAWGSGADLALGAMEHGAPAYVAVEIASRRNAYCGGSIAVFDVVVADRLLEAA